MVISNKKLCEVYWIRHIDHSDFSLQGYIGISTKGAARRFVAHKSAARKGSQYPVHKAIRKYKENIIVETLLIGTPTYCAEMEKALRPSQGIGWNLAIGGAKTLLGFKHTDATKVKISENNGMRGRRLSEGERLQRKKNFLGKAHSEETKEKLSIAALERISEDKERYIGAAVRKAAEVNRSRHSWEVPTANKDVWKMADVFYKSYQENTEMNVCQLGRLFSIPHSALHVLFKKLKAGWVPSKDPNWLDFIKSGDL